MFDFRYHALSLAAVLLGVLVGVLLGVAIGDAGLVSSAEKKVRESLRGDVREARAQAAGLRAEVAAHERFEQEAYPTLVAGRLEGRRIGVIGLGDVSDRTVQLVRAALQHSGGRLAAVLVVRRPPRLAEIADRAAGTRYTLVGADEDLTKPFGRRMGEQLTQGGRLVRRLRRVLLSSSSGALAGLEGVVLVRDANVPDGKDGAAVRAFEDGLVQGLLANDVPVVGVETTSADRSQIGWFKDRDVASVDNVDQLAGRAALVFALAGADGSFGVKSTADALLPSVVG